MATDPLDLGARTIVTTRCGLGRSSLAEAEVAFNAAATAANLIQEVAEDNGSSLPKSARGRPSS
jgi:hypothetical protein